MSIVNCYQFAISNNCKLLNIRKIALILSLIICLNSNSFSVDITSGIVGYWPLEWSPMDTSGNNNNAQIFGNPKADSGKINLAYHFNGKSDYLTLDPNGSKKYFDVNGFSWALWFKCDSFPKTKNTKLSRTLISAMDSVLGEDILLGFGDDYTEENLLSFRTDGKGGVGGFMQKTPRYAPVGGFKDSVWYHAVGVCDYKNKKSYLYVDGKAVDSVTLGNSFEALDRDMRMMFAVGNYDKTLQGYFAGMLDEIRIFNRPLNSQEVNYIYRLKANQLTAESKIINFGNIISKRDSVYNLKLTNLGPDTFKITSTKLTQNINYTIVNGGNITLKDGEIYPLQIKFNPIDSGSYSDTLIIENNQNVLPLKIYLSGSKIINIKFDNEDIKFADVIMCDDKAKAIAVLKITNLNAPDSLILTKVNFSNNVFDISDKLPIKIGLNETKDLNLVFTPAGTKGSNPKCTLTLNFDSSYTNRKINLSAVARDINLKQNLDSLDFGKVIIANKKDSIITFINNGTAEFKINKISKPNTVYFDVTKLPNKSLDSLLSLDTIKLFCRYIGQAGEQSDSINIELENTCGKYYKTYYFKAKGAYEAKFDIYSVSDIASSDTSLNTGTLVKFPIIIKNTDKLKESELKEISFDLIYNSSLLIPSDASKTFTKLADYNIYNLKYQIDNTQKYIVLYSPEFKVALGNKIKDSIKINNFNPINAFAKVNIVNGTLTLGNVCKAGGSNRLVIIKDSLYLTSISPNPASNKLNFDFELIEKGNTKAIMLNSKGEIIKELFEEYLSNGVYSKSIDISEVPNGQYFLVLTTPNQELFKQLQVVR